jgi:hypothetical protein
MTKPTKFRLEKLKVEVQSENFRIDGVNNTILLKNKLGMDWV